MAISLFLLLTIPLSIGFFFVRPYEEAAWATFYRDITAAPTEPDEAYWLLYYFSDVTGLSRWSAYGEETWPFRNNCNDPLICFNAGAYGIKSDENGFTALVVGTGSALAWHTSVPWLGLLALGDLSQRFLYERKLLEKKILQQLCLWWIKEIFYLTILTIIWFSDFFLLWRNQFVTGINGHAHTKQWRIGKVFMRSHRFFDSRINASQHTEKCA